MTSWRTGQGIDAHAFCTGRPLVLGGVRIPYEKGLAGHSDADVLVHAIMDALLGAAAMGDIGRLFPPTDNAYKDISSLDLLEKVSHLLTINGWMVVNVDATIIAENPRVSPFKKEMENNIQKRIAGKPVINVKATTTEGLGFTGRGEGVASLAVALISRNKED
ncbi:2-C-methyl-D-erythritol 2,4-cyclodiphosphate synthase [Candidatus Sumerlaeota bacterium]|nr:2-C-methyl-D-erythritol 2,4-cyclodiphosphate synthase [Candidatus Sumerlaeota bacterium]